MAVANEEKQCRLYFEKVSVLLSTYKWLLDSFIIEYFVDNHWSQLPLSWRESLRASDDSSLLEIARVILADGTLAPVKRVFPLSLLSFAAACRSFSLVSNHSQSAAEDIDPPLTPLVRPQVDDTPLVRPQVDGLDHSFRRHVKPKKQHEIKKLGKVVSDICQQVNCLNVVDIGSGQGHLARYLAYHHCLKVTAVEAVGGHLTAAAEYDRKVQADMDKKMRKERDLSSTQEGREGERGGSLRHVEAVIKSDISVADFLSQISTVQTPPTTTTTSTAQQEEAGLILTGLHPCGDLCTTILRIFARSNQVVGVVCVGCCYMKLTTLLNHTPSIDHTSSGGHTPSKDHASSSGHTPSSDHTSMGECEGYPMSRFLKECGHILSYEARELACHSIATYKERFKEAGGFEYLKVHSFRAVVETLLRKNGLRRSQVRIAKRVSKMPFQRYAEKLLQSVLSSSDPPPALSWSKEQLSRLEELVEQEWRQVVVFFLLRLALAPVVEASVLLDRKLFLLEQGNSQVWLFPVFYARISPRNIALVAKKDRTKHSQ